MTNIEAINKLECVGEWEDNEYYVFQLVNNEILPSEYPDFLKKFNIEDDNIRGICLQLWINSDDKAIYYDVSPINIKYNECVDLISYYPSQEEERAIKELIKKEVSTWRKDCQEEFIKEVGELIYN